MLCSLEKIWKYFNGEPLLRDINFTINEGERIGLVGRNGCGKTTLLSIITGNLGYDPSPENDGRMSFSGNCRIGYLEQGVGLSTECSVSEEMRKPFAELDREHERIAELEDALSGKLSDSEREKAESEYSRISTHFENNEGYLIDVKIKTVLNGMGFSGLDLSRSVNSLSGGERTRLSLAKLLLESPSLLILDEPTNHLDLDTMTWLEDYLLDYKGAILVVSHNRYFLDRVCTRICEIEDGKLKSYSGNYSFYVKQKREDNLHQEKLYEAEQEKIKELQFFIDKNRVSATSAKAAKSKQHMLDRIVDNAVEKPKMYEKSAKIKLEYDIEPPKEVFSAENIDVSVGGKTLLESFSLNMRRGDKVGIIGKNGTGKTTILKTVQGINSHSKGRINWAQNVKLAYYDQKNEYLNPNNTVIEEIHRRYPRMTDYEVRSVLGSVLLTGENVFKEVGVISGGEKTKLSFALMSLKRGNFLILDEPTNHLDISTKEVLEDALKEYTGTILFVSHDRYLLNKIADRIIEIRDGKAYEYKGNYDDYLKARELEKEEAEKVAVPSPTPAEKKQYRTKSQRAEDVRKKQELADLEKSIANLEKEIADTEELICTPEVASDYQKMTELCQSLDDRKNELSELMDRWIEIQE
ncbi:MAG: ABC-F family ATP-binding cassette domain-containing protein [Oscillospiraceae bacterium]|nr:ABC-F family ATP-binding cassette domain-containing protein [Oscillospiraceae bacterium]